MSLLYFRNEGITLATLKSHAKKDHSLELNIKEKKAIISSPLICEYCSKSYARPQTLRNHIKKHHSNQTQDQIFSQMNDNFSLPSNTVPAESILNDPLTPFPHVHVESLLDGLIAEDPDLGLRIQQFPICQKPEEKKHYM